VNIAVANAGGPDSHEYFAALRRIDADLFDYQRLPERVTYGGFHLHSGLRSGQYRDYMPSRQVARRSKMVVTPWGQVYEQQH
jgi:hypothetical protein